MKLQRVFRKAVALAAAACMTLGCFSQLALADYAGEGDTLDRWVCQVVVQNGTNDEHSSLWMNDGVFDSITYKTTQHVTLEPATGAFANTEDVLNFAAIYFSYYGEYFGDAQFDITLTNVTIHSTGYDPIVIADYSSVDAGTNYPTSGNDYAVRYDFQDQLDLSIRTDVLRNLEYIEFDLYVDVANFSDAPQVDPATGVPYTELATAGETAGLDLVFYAMDTNWSWVEAGETVKLNYQTDEHVSIAIDGATAYAEAVGPMNVAGFMVAYYTDQYPEDANYSIDYTISNVVMYFDGYDPVALGDLYSSSADKDRDGAYALRSMLSLELLPADVDTAELFRHLTSIEFDYHVSYLGVAVEQEEPEETTTEEPETEEPEETTTEEPEETTTEEPEETTTAAPETEAAEETTEEATAAQAAASDDDSNNNTAKIVVTIVAVVILFAALAVVGVMYVKKSKQF